MRLITAHRILIATSVIFFFGFSFWQLARYLQSGDGWALLQALGYFCAAIGFGLYFVNIKRWYR
jgi:drug/metabolite transporter (DMT)-like permease